MALSRCFKRDATAVSSSMKLLGRVIIREAKSRMTVTQLGAVMSIKFIGTLLILTLAPGGGGGINKREQA